MVIAHNKYFLIILKFILVLLTLDVIYVVLLTASYSIPDASIKQAVNIGQQVIDQEGFGPEVFFGGSWACRLDNFTDIIMLQTAIKGDQNPLIAAINDNGYARYWHGYQVFLRPLCLLGSYINIRYINMFVFFTILSVVLILLKEQFGWKISLLLLITLLSTYSFIVPMSLQFSGVYYVFLLSIIGIILYYKKNRNIPAHLYIVFLVIGSITNFIDLLTFPLLTLGMPLIVLCITILEKKLNKSILPVIIQSSLSWGIGYGVTWISKWVIATIILKTNIISDAIENAKFRSFGDMGETPLNRLNMLISNIRNYMPSQSLKVGLYVIIVLIMVWLIFMIFAHKKFNDIKMAFPLIIVIMMPFAWFLVMANHSQVHHWFTYRIQMITMFALLYFLAYCIDFTKLKSLCKR